MTKPWNEIPGLTELPIIGPLHHFLPIIGDKELQDPFTMQEALHKKYGDIVRLGKVMSSVPMVVLFNPEHIKQALRNDEPMPNRVAFELLTYFRSHIRKDYFGGMTGVSTNDLKAWKSYHSIVSPILLSANRIEVHKKATDQVAEDMIDRIRFINKSQNSLRDGLLREMKKFSVETIALIGLGRRIGCLDNDLDVNSPANQLINNVDDIFSLTWKLEIAPGLRLWKYIPTLDYRKLMQAQESALTITDHFIKESIKEIETKRNINADAGKSVLENLLDIDEKIAVITANDLLFGGVEIISSAIVNFMYLLAVNPEKQSHLREEIKKGETGYLKAVIKEGFRLSNPAAGMTRRTTKELTIGGFSIPEGVDIMYPTLYLNSLDEYYPRAKEFLPERWLADKSSAIYSKNYPYMNIPFGFGSRMCLGKRIAHVTIESFFTKFVENFEIRWEGAPMESKQQPVTTPLPPYNFIINEC